MAVIVKDNNGGSNNTSTIHIKETYMDYKFKILTTYYGNNSILLYDQDNCLYFCYSHSSYNTTSNPSTSNFYLQKYNILNNELTTIKSISNIKNSTAILWGDTTCYMNDIYKYGDNNDLEFEFILNDDIYFLVFDDVPVYDTNSINYRKFSKLNLKTNKFSFNNGISIPQSQFINCCNNEDNSMVYILSCKYTSLGNSKVNRITYIHKFDGDNVTLLYIGEDEAYNYSQLSSKRLIMYNNSLYIITSNTIFRVNTDGTVTEILYEREINTIHTSSNYFNMGGIPLPLFKRGSFINSFGAYNRYELCKDDPPNKDYTYGYIIPTFGNVLIDIEKAKVLSYNININNENNNIIKWFYNINKMKTIKYASKNKSVYGIIIDGAKYDDKNEIVTTEYGAICELICDHILLECVLNKGDQVYVNDWDKVEGNEVSFSNNIGIINQNDTKVTITISEPSPTNRTGAITIFDKNFNILYIRVNEIPDGTIGGYFHKNQKVNGITISNTGYNILKTTLPLNIK